MKLLRYGPAGSEKPGALDANGTIRDLSGIIDDVNGDTLSPANLDELKALNLGTLPEIGGDLRLGPPVADVSKVVCIGLNYSDHAAETGSPIPSEPIIFMKAPTAISGPNDDIMLPRGSEKTDWEVELGIVIGKRASYVEESEALEYVAGYCVVNDVSERAFQIEGTGQWVKGKSADSFCPFGPWMVTKDEIDDPNELGIWLTVDGERCQNGSTNTMIFNVPHLISYISRHMTLLPGDLIPTGTPPGVGMGMNPQQFLRPGNVVRLGIDGLGEQEQKVVAFRFDAVVGRRHEALDGARGCRRI